MTDDFRVLSADTTAPTAFAETGSDVQFIADGSTTNIAYFYLSPLGPTGKALTQALKATSEADYTRLANLFGVTVPWDETIGAPIGLYLIPGDQGGRHMTCRNPQIMLSTYSGTDQDLVRFLAIAEESEVFMAVQDVGWNCGSSNGEALSRVLATDFYPAELNAPGVAYGWATAHYWLDSDRPDFVSENFPTDKDNISLGCAALFINYLRFQLGHELKEIIQKGGPTLADTYRNLTGKTDAFGPFKQLMDTFFPPGPACGLLTDNPFPLGQWESLSGVLAHPPAVLAMGSGTIQVFAVGPDSALYRNVWNSRWLGWEPLHGALVGSPTVLSRAPGLIDVFGVGLDSAVWQLSWDGTQWGQWTSLGGPAFSDVAAVSLGADRLDLLMVGQDSALLHSFWDGSKWSPWDNGGGFVLSRPSVVAWNGELQIVGLGGNSDLYHLVYKPADGFIIRESLNDALTSAPVIVARDQNQLDVFFRSTDMTLHHRSWSDGWGEHSVSVSGPLASEPRAIAPSATELRAVAVSATDHALLRLVWSDSTGTWAATIFDDGGVISSVPVPLSVLPNLLDTFVVGMDHAIWHKRACDK
ncbi:hypothetical protein OH768_35700 [Streptomyces sp. NBC_01622]|uniref:hypothetical protein n=1 Tax=Streptomyces sp. NBC_01622 TaxID=2975903 RepID=UPI00386D70CB|nr:hypothetical protein OH768_35700 [Streptomyces sp. NBC_01622]